MLFINCKNLLDKNPTNFEPPKKKLHNRTDSNKTKGYLSSAAITSSLHCNTHSVFRRFLKNKFLFLIIVFCSYQFLKVHFRHLKKHKSTLYHNTSEYVHSKTDASAKYIFSISENPSA